MIFFVRSVKVVVFQVALHFETSRLNFSIKFQGGGLLLNGREEF